jgi:uncharacterized protein involved in outer membrane biogenesis
VLGRVMVAIGGFVVLALFTALLAPFFVEWSSFRVEFEQQASRMLGKKVSVHGAVDARILPFPSITLHDVRVGQDVDGAPQARIARFSMDMELAPFLSGEARIFDMRIEEPSARVRILKDGTLDWMRGSRPAIPTRVVVIEDVHVIGASIAVIDEQSGRSRNLTGMSAEMSAASLTGPWRGDGFATLDGQEARFSLSTGSADAQTRQLPVRLRLWPDAEPLEINLDGAVAVANNVPTYSGSFAASILQEENETEPVDAPPPGPRVKGSFELTNDRIRIADYRLEVGAVDDPYVVTGEATLDTGSNPEFLLTADGQQIDVSRLGGGDRGKTGRDAAASAQRRLQAFVEMAASIPVPDVPGRASLKLPAMVLNDTTIRDIQLDVQPANGGWTVDRAIATLPGRTRMEAKGDLVLENRPSFVGEMLFASSQPSGLADWLSGRVDPAIRQLRSAGFSANVNLTTDLQRFEDLELAIGSATLRGRVERNSAQSGAAGLSVDLEGDEIDLDAMRALSSLITGDDAGMDVLDHRLVANLKAQRFTAFGVAAGNVDTAFTMAGGVLSLDRLSVDDVAGASITGEGRVEGSLLDYRGTARLRLRSADPGAFMAMLRQKLPAHPVLERLAGNAAFLAETDLSADVTLGDGGAKAKITGAMNGSSVVADIELPTLFELTAADALSLSAVLENPRSEILLGQAGLEILPFGGDGAGRLAIDIRQPSGEPGQAMLDFTTERTELRADGTIMLGAENLGEGRGRVSLKSRDIEPYLLLTGVGIPQFGSGLPVTVETDFAVTADVIGLTGLRGDLDGNGFEGQLDFDRHAAGLKAEGAISADAMDMSWLGEAVFGPLADPATGAPSERPFALPVFGNSDVSITAKARVFHAAELGAISDFSARIVHRGGGISIEDASGNWNGGRIGGRLQMSNGDGTGIVQARLDAENVDLSSVVWQKDNRPVATGRMSFEASAEASGGNVGALIGALSGSGTVRLSDLATDGVDIDLLSRLMASVDTARQDVTEEQVSALVAGRADTPRAEFGEVSIPFTITAGDVRIQEVRARAGAVGIATEGHFNLLTDEMDAAIAITYDAGREAVAGGDAMVRLLYSGDRRAPERRVDVAAMTNFLSMRAYEQERRRVEMLQSSVLEKQRLRREVALYNFRAAERAAEEARLREEEQARIAIIEAARAAEAERQRERQSLRLDLPPMDGITAPQSPSDPFGSGTLPEIGQ